MTIPILVTGGAGYIGSHTCKLLAKSGFLPITYDNLSTGHRYAVKWGPFVQGDINDGSKLLETFKLYRPHAVLHFAAKAIVSESMQRPELYYRDNVAGSICLFEAMLACGVKKLVFSSTCATYGHPESVPITEEHPQRPISPYGRSKWMIEQIANDLKVHGLQTMCLRYFNAAGADLETEIGENHLEESHLIPSVIQVALGQKQEVCVFGNDFPTKDGSALRDYIHVTDLASAHAQALKHLLAGFDGSAVNLGSGEAYSVFEIIDAIRTFSSLPIRMRVEKRRMGDPAHLVADAKKAASLLGWKPKHSTLSTVIESAWKWHRLLATPTS